MLLPGDVKHSPRAALCSGIKNRRSDFGRRQISIVNLRFFGRNTLRTCRWADHRTPGEQAADDEPEGNVFKAQADARRDQHDGGIGATSSIARRRASSSPLTATITPKMLWGNTWQNVISVAPKRTAIRNLLCPKTESNRCRPCPKAVLPCQAAGAVAHRHRANQHPIKFISPTEIETRLGVAGRSGNRSADSAHTAMTEFNVVSGICGSAALGNAVRKSPQPGGDHPGSVISKPIVRTTSG